MEQTSSNSYVQFNIKKCNDESPDTPNYSLHKRHVFVMTQVGRPIFVRFGDEVDLSSFLATLAAIIEKWKIYFNADKAPSTMQKIQFSDKVLYFFYRKNLCYICSTTRTNESAFMIQTMLEFLNIQIISIITDSVNKKLDARPNHDPRSLLGGTNFILAHSIKNGLNSPCFFLNAIMCLPLAPSARNTLHNVIKELKNDKIICTMLLTQTYLVDIYKQKGYDFKTQDILLIQNLLQAQTSLRNSENWIPLCLPGIASEGFIYAYIYFFTKELAVIMVSDETTNEMFFICQNISKQLHERLKTGHSLDSIMQQVNTMPYVNKLCFGAGGTAASYPAVITNNNTITANSQSGTISKLEINSGGQGSSSLGKDSVSGGCSISSSVNSNSSSYYTYNSSNIKHFIIKMQDSDQFTMPKYNIFGKATKEFKRYLTKYADIYKTYLQIDIAKRKECLIFEKGDIGIYGVYANEEYVILFVLDQFLALAEINTNLNSIIKWVKAEETTYFLPKYA